MATRCFFSLSSIRGTLGTHKKKSIFSSSSTIRACNGTKCFFSSPSIKGAASGHQGHFFLLVD